MTTSTIVGLVNNTALLLVLGLLYDILLFERPEEKSFVSKLIAGGFIGLLGLALMMTPWEFIPGLVFDSRSVLLCVSGFFFGPVPTLTAMALTGGSRLYLGGVGAWTGFAVIVTSGGIGLVWQRFRKKNLDDVPFGELYLFGILVHLAMLGWMFFLPWPMCLDVLRSISLPVMLIFPLGTALLGKLLAGRYLCRENERLLRKSEAYLKSIMDNLPIGIALNSVDSDLEFEYMNDNFFRYYRTTRGALKDPGSFWEAVYEDPGFRQKIKQKVLADCHSGNPEQMRWQDVPITRRGEKTSYITAQNIPMPENQQMISTVWNVTERKQAEDALKESTERYKKIFENALVGVYQIGLDGKFILANQKMLEMFGCASYEELAGVGSLADLYARPKDYQAVVKDINAKGVVIDEFEFRRKGGESIWGRVYAQKTTTRDGVTIFEGVMEDVTQIKQMEAKLQQAHKLEAIGTLSGGIAHDFNNILSSVIGFTELSLEDAEPNTMMHDNLTEVLVAGKRAKDLVRQIMTFGRKDEQAKKPVSLNSLITEAMGMLRATISSNIKIKEHISDREFIVNANASQINQVLLNLVTNAAHAVDENGRIEIGMKTTRIDEKMSHRYPDLMPGEYAELFVSDNGCGIVPENLDLIFDPYFTTKGPDKGTGLGLSVVHGIVKLHNGQITVESEVGKGTKFQVFLPLVDLPVSARPARSQGRLPEGSGHILVVDDDPAIVNIQKQMLKRLGYTVCIQTSSVDALAQFQASPDGFDLIITDMTMPKMNGDRLVRLVKEIRPDIPVILCTGFSEKINAKTAERIMIDAFLMKPVSINEMAQTIRRVLDDADTADKPRNQ